MHAMNTHSQTISTVIDPSAWQQAMYAVLAEKERRSGSRRTVESYSRMLQHFFGVVGTTPDRVTGPEVLSWAHGIGLSGRQPLRSDRRSADSLPLQLLQGPHPDGDARFEPLRRARTAQGPAIARTGLHRH